MARAAAPNASTAAIVCTRSCHVNASPTGSGHPVVHGTWEATKNRDDDTANDTDGDHIASQCALPRRPRAAHATQKPPPTSSSSASSNHSAVDSPAAPKPFTYTVLPILARALQMSTIAAATRTAPATPAHPRADERTGRRGLFSWSTQRRYERPPRRCILLQYLPPTSSPTVV